MNVIVGIATSGRADTLNAMLRHLESQMRPPDGIVISANKPADVDGISGSFPSVRIVFAAAGASSQRNAIICSAIDADMIVFFDDDFFPQVDFLQAVERHMQDVPATVVLSGEVIADGINGPGLSMPECMALLAKDWARLPDRHSDFITKRQFAGYGCNMAVRMSAIRSGNLRFDENLPLYSWQEDVDLSRRLAVFGEVVKLGGARGVHLGVKSGRGSGVKLGYSQVANPIYLALKRNGYPFSWAFRHIVKNVAKNLIRSLWPESYVDRRGRLRGNFKALCELFHGRMSPKRILDL